MYCEICDMENCADHGPGRERVRRSEGSGAGGSRDGYPTSGAAEHLDTAGVTDEVMADGLPVILAEIPTASGSRAVHLFAEFCAKASHWEEPSHPKRARQVAALATAVALRTSKRSRDILALVENAEPVPFTERGTWIAEIDAQWARRKASRLD